MKKAVFIYFDEQEADRLWHSAAENFIKKQKNRFTLLTGEENQSGHMYFCSSYLEAKFLAAVFETETIYVDELFDEDTGNVDYIVIDTRSEPRGDNYGASSN